MNKTVGIMLILVIIVLSGALYYQYTELNSIKTENLDLNDKVSAFETAIEIRRESAQTFYETLNDDIELPSGDFGYTLERLNDVDEMTVERKKDVYLEAKVNFENYISNVGFAD